MVRQLNESDLTTTDWSQAEWDNYELWEKIEVRLRRKKRLWIMATVIVFLTLSAVPIAMDRWPKWVTRSIVRHLAQEISWVKREAGMRHLPLLFRLKEEGSFDFVIQKVPSCDRPEGEVVRSGHLLEGDGMSRYLWISFAKGIELGIPGIVSEFCYDPLSGSSLFKRGDALAGFAVSPVTDLTEKRLDRTTVLLLSGPFAEISFD